MGVVVLEHLANDTGTLGEMMVVAQTFAQHSVENTTLYGFEAIPHIGERTRYDNAHGVVEVGGADLRGNFCWSNCSYFHNIFLQMRRLPMQMTASLSALLNLLKASDEYQIGFKLLEKNHFFVGLKTTCLRAFHGVLYTRIAFLSRKREHMFSFSGRVRYGGYVP